MQNEFHDLAKCKINHGIIYREFITLKSKHADFINLRGSKITPKKLLVYLILTSTASPPHFINVTLNIFHADI